LSNVLFYPLEIFDCSSADLKKLVDETFTEPGKTYSSGPQEEILDETFT
jgi:hypothetical protein